MLRDAPAGARVPSCPDWNADDLLWHLGEVQWFWGTIVREKVSDGSEAERLKPPRPVDRADLFAFYERASRDLRGILAANTPDTHAWTWSTDQTVGFIRRRQAHEALIHRIDAELTAGNPISMDAQLSADGVDEALRIMYGGLPPWGTISPSDERELRLHATDTDDSWLVTLGWFSGTDPEDRTVYDDEPDIQVADADHGGEAAATVTGRAADLDCWLWHRPTVVPVARSGDQELIGRFESTIAEGIN